MDCMQRVLLPLTAAWYTGASILGYSVTDPSIASLVCLVVECFHPQLGSARILLLLAWFFRLVVDPSIPEWVF